MIRSQEKGGHSTGRQKARLVRTYMDKDTGERKRPYTNIPDYILMVLHALDLKPQEYKLYMYLRMNMNNNEPVAFPGARAIARDAKITSRYIKPARDSLIQLGLISIARSKGSRGQIKVEFNDSRVLTIAEQIDRETEEQENEKLGRKLIKGEYQKLRKRWLELMSYTVDYTNDLPDPDPDENNEEESSENEDEVSSTDDYTVSSTDDYTDVVNSGLRTNMNTTTTSSTNLGEDVSKEEEDVLPTSAPTLPPVNPIADAKTKIEGGVVNSGLHLAETTPKPLFVLEIKEADDSGAVDEDDDDDDDDEEVVDEEAERIAKRRERLIRWHGERWESIPLYDPQQEEKPYIEQFLLMNDTSKQARDALIVAIGEWNALHPEKRVVMA